MNAAIIGAFCLLIFGLGYNYYGKYIYGPVFGMDETESMPAHEFRDGIDYVPSNKWVLFGHHFASISGLGPIVGPAIAVIWGWLPALLWVLFGTIFIGAVHDFTSLGISIHHQGRSVGDVASDIINERSRTLFLILIFFLIALAMGVFAYVIAVLFAKMYPATILPVFALMTIAVLMGGSMRGNLISLRNASILGLLLLSLSIWHSAGIEVIQPDGAAVAEAMKIPVWLGLSITVPLPGITGWTYILMAYAFIASVLPVWLLLQPRDYLNSFLLYFGLITLYGGLFIVSPTISAPALNTGASAPADLPPLFPILFITVACGAISGFHSLVSSGTTAKQLDKAKDSRMVGYGGMIAEGILALIVLLSCVAGLGGIEAWQTHYGSWSQASGLGAKLGAFIDGGATFISAMAGFLGITQEMAQIFISLVAVSFAMTTLDSGTRLLRYNIEELAESISDGETVSGVNRWTSSLIAVIAIGFLALLEVNGKPAGIFLWVLFGASNQLLAALGLLTVSVYLYKRGKPTLPTLIPMLFMIIVTTFALAIQFFQQMPMEIRRPFANTLGINPMPDQPGSWVIFSMVILISILAGWFIIEAINTYQRYSPDKAQTTEQATP